MVVPLPAPCLQIMYNSDMFQMKWMLSAILFGISLVVALPANAACVNLPRTIVRGSSGGDVTNLQRFLNSDASTQIAIIGDNAPGQENGVFDLATDAAVKAFQLKYKEEILVPVGLTKPNGVVGKFTRQFISRLSCGAMDANRFFITSDTSKATVSTVNAAEAAKKLADLRARVNAILVSSSADIDSKMANLTKKTAVVEAKIAALDSQMQLKDRDIQLLDKLSSSDDAYLSPATSGVFGQNEPLHLGLLSSVQAHRGERIALLGSGFLSKNKVYIGDLPAVIASPNASGTVMYVTIPSNAPTGKTALVVMNDKGKSESRPFIIVSGDAAPHITSISPTRPTLGAAVVITGDHFSSKNDIVTTFGPIGDVRSTDGKTLQFTLNPSGATLFGASVAKTLPLSIGVSNENGVSNILTFSPR